jgi:hypothetical protein
MISWLLIVLLAVSWQEIQSNEILVRQSRPLSSTFDEISVNGVLDVYLEQVTGTAPPSVEVETDTSNQNHVVVQIIDGHVLSLSIRGATNFPLGVSAVIRFNFPLHRYTSRGSGNTFTKNKGLVYKGVDKLIVMNSGAGNIDIRVDVALLDVSMSGAGSGRFRGRVRQQVNFDVKGASQIDASELTAQQALVSASDASELSVSATDDIRIHASGASTVHFRLPDGRQPSKAVASVAASIVPM